MAGIYIKEANVLKLKEFFMKYLILMLIVSIWVSVISGTVSILIENTKIYNIAHKSFLFGAGSTVIFLLLIASFGALETYW